MIDAMRILTHLATAIVAAAVTVVVVQSRGCESTESLGLVRPVGVAPQG
jgi:hypothetical protein